MSAKRENFGSRWAVIFAMAGSAIGLGNIWRFPYMVGEHGGSAFIVIYVIATLMVSLPVFVAEVVIGRRSRQGAYSAMSTLQPGKKVWKMAGFLSVFTPVVICAYYSVIGGWSLGFFFRALSGSFVRNSPDEVTGIFSAFVSSGWEPVVMHLLFLAACCYVVAHGVRSGIEKFSKICIPVLFVLILAMIGYSLTLPGSFEGVKYMVVPDFRQIDARSFAYALGQSFYSLSLGMGAILTYGSYVSDKENLLVSSTGTAISDLLFAILAGLAIMPAVFASGSEPGAGPGLIFQGIPYIFSTMGVKVPVFSAVISLIFFLTIVVAAMTSCISLVEVGSSFLNEKFGIGRKKAVTIIFLVCGTLGLGCALSGRVFDVCDWFCSNILLLTLAFIVVIFVGFVMKRDDVRDEITNHGTENGNSRVFPLVYFLIKWVCPIAIAAIFISNFIL